MSDQSKAGTSPSLGPTKTQNHADLLRSEVIQARALEEAPVKKWEISSYALSRAILHQNLKELVEFIDHGLDVNTKQVRI